MYKKISVIIFFIFIYTVLIFAQEKRKQINIMLLNASIDIDDAITQNMSGEDDGNAPFAIGSSAGFEYSISKYFGLESGFLLSSYFKKIKRSDNRNEKINGIYLGPYISSKIYLIPFSDNGGSLYIENRLSMIYSTMNFPSSLNQEDVTKNILMLYNFYLGSSFRASKKIMLNFFIGYNSLKLSKIANTKYTKENNKMPFNFGIGLSFFL